jgi:hypothetical protein
MFGLFPGCRPAVPGQGNSFLDKDDAFPFKKGLLLLIVAAPFRERDFTLGVDYTMPGNIRSKRKVV